MTNGTERDEPGQRSTDGPDGTVPAQSSSPSSDPVWPVWGGGTEPVAEPEAPTDEQQGGDEPTEPAPDEAAPAEPAADEAGADEATVDGPPTDDDAIPGDRAEPAAEPEVEDEPADESVDADVSVAPSDAADEPDADDEATAADTSVAQSDADDEPTAADTSVDQPRADDEPAAADTPVADDRPLGDATSADEPVAASTSVDQPVADATPVDHSTAADGPVDEPTAAAAVDDVVEPVPSVSTDERLVGADGADEPAAEPVDDQIVGTTADATTDADEAPGAERADSEPVGTDSSADSAPEPTNAPADLSQTSSGDAPEQSADAADTGADAESEPDVAAATTPADEDARAATAILPAAAAAAASTATEPPARGPGGRDDATAVMAPVASSPSPTQPPVGTLAAPVTRTVPGAPPATVAPTPSGPVSPGATAAATAAAAGATAAGTAAAAPAAGTTAPAPAAGVTAAGPTSGTAAAGPAAGTTAAAPAAAAASANPAASATPAAAAPTAAAATAAAAAAAAASATAATPAAPTAAAARPQVQPRPTTPPEPKTQSPISSGPVPPSERSESPLDVFEAEDGKRRWPKRLLIAGVIVLVLGAVYVGASYALADRVPRGATVAGVDIGGLTSDEAVARLDEELADATTQPVEVVANDVQATVDPTAAGLTFDSQATVDQLTGVDLADPSRLWAHLAGVGAQDPVTSVDEEALSAAIGDLGASLALAPVDGTVVFVDATPQSTAAVDGWNLDQAGAAEVLADDWLVAARPLELPTATVEPDITQEETDAALVEARQVTSAPVTVSVAGQSALLDAPTLAANASFVPVDGGLVLQMNGEGLTEVVLAQLPDLLTQSADAHFEFVNDAPVIVPGIPGTSLDPAALATTVAAATAAPDRTATVELVQADPSESTAELEALGVKEIVSEFSTPLNSEPRRTVNITNGASKISGTLIRPDETFSLTEALGPIDAAHGYVEAGAIVSGEHTDAWGGGLSQVSTTTYNAAFLAGFEDIEHRPHSEWFARYPEGREATIFTGTLDMRWKNNTPYGALVQAWVSDGRVYVRVWGTKHWTVDSITSPRSGVVAPTTVYSQSPTCEAQSAGNPGFSVTVTRKTYLNGALEKTESNSWRYKPQNKVICGAPPTATPPATP